MDARTPDLGPETLTKSISMTDTTAVGWRADAAAGTQRSLPEVNSTIAVPFGGHWSRRLLAFLGPGYLVSVGYMDPGNWATDLAGGSKFGYTLLSVILLSNLMAILLQGLASKLGIVTGRDLAQACPGHLSRPRPPPLWGICAIPAPAPRGARPRPHRPGGRPEVGLLAAGRHPALDPRGDSAARARLDARDRPRTGPGAGGRGSLPAAQPHRAVGDLRDRHRRQK